MDPVTLYHYTSSRGLVGIIENRELWFSDVRFLNDSQEFKHFCDMVENSIRSQSAKYRQSWIERGCKDVFFDAMVRNLCSGCRSDSMFQWASKYGHPFVFSLSGERDSLSQWRAYGNGEYCIGFDIEKLCRIRDFSLLKIDYSEPRGQTSLSGMIDWFFEKHFQDIRSDGSIDPEVFYSGLDDMLSKSKADDFLRNKDAAFKSENESRLVVYKSINDEQVFFDPTGRCPIPRIKVKSINGQDAILDAIVEIICGPGADIERSEAAIRLMGQRTTQHSFIVTSSKVPYRSN